MFDRETFKVLREMVGPWRVVLVVLAPVMVFVLGYTGSGPLGGSGLLPGLGALLLMIGLLAAGKLFLKLKFGRVFAAYDRVTEQLNAMTPEQIRAAAISAVESTPYFRAFTAASPLDPALPAGAADFFAIYERLDFVLPDNPSAFWSICRTLVGPVPNNPDAVKIGELHIHGSCVAVHVPTGRITTHQPPIRPGEVARCGEVLSLRHLSVWHMIAQSAALARLGEEMGHRFFARHELQGTRPAWRINGAST